MTAEAINSWVFFIARLLSPVSNWVRGRHTAPAVHGPFDTARARPDSRGAANPARADSSRIPHMPPSVDSNIAWAGPPPRPWQRVSVRLAAVFALVTVLAIGAVGL